MSYRVEVDFSPAYELAIALKAYANKKSYKTLEAGVAWAEQVRAALPPGFDDQLAAFESAVGTAVSGSSLLLEQGPARQSVPESLAFLAALSPAELYSRMATHAGTEQLPGQDQLAALRDQYLTLLCAFNEHYFCRIDRAILAALASDADAKRRLISTTAPEDLIELVTNGLRVSAAPDLERVLLVPQYHSRPLNVIDSHRRHLVIAYPVDALPASPGEPSPALLRLTRALDDESRLKMLRLIAGGPCSFTDVVGATGLAKSTVHHHLVVLRAAGLLRVHDPAQPSSRYTLRPGSVESLGALLSAFLKGD